MTMTIETQDNPTTQSATPTHDVDTVAHIDGDSFLKNYIQPKQPLVITGMMDSWPAMNKWSFEFFRDLNSESTVHIEEGNIMQGETGFRKQTFRDYIQQLIEQDSESAAGAYLSVFKVFDEFPQLRDDVDFSLLNQHKIKHSTVGWLGPAGTVTGYHIDWGDNILAQVHGRKCVHLAAPEDTPNMYVSKKFDQGARLSEVDLHNWDEEKFPLFGKVKHQKIILDAGQMLFIPRGWWHHVESMDKSISVSNLTYDLSGILFDAIPHRIKQIVHNAGLWKCDCTCHVWRDGKWVRK